MDASPNLTPLMDMKPCKKLNLNELLVNKMAKIVERLVGNGNGILINFILGQDIRDVEADENDIEQLILNIAIKARHEIKKGGNLIISTKNVSVNHAKERNASQIGAGFLCEHFIFL